MPELSIAAQRLLDALAAEGAYGFSLEPEEPGILAVVGQRNGISLRRMSAPLAAAQELERSGLAVWQGPARSGRCRLVLTGRGWAKLLEIAAPPDFGAVQPCRERGISYAEAEICP